MSHTLSACLPRLARPLPMPHALMASTSLPEQYNERRPLPDRDQHVTFPSSLLVRASTCQNLKQPGWDHYSTNTPCCSDWNSSRKPSTSRSASRAGQQSLDLCGQPPEQIQKLSCPRKVPEGWYDGDLPGAYKDFLGTGSEPRHTGATNKGESAMEHVPDGLGGPLRGPRDGMIVDASGTPSRSISHHLLSAPRVALLGTVAWWLGRH